MGDKGGGMQVRAAIGKAPLMARIFVRCKYCTAFIRNQSNAHASIRATTYP